MTSIAAMPTDAPAAPDNQDVPVPPLRQELEVCAGWPTHSGEPTWMLYDPLRNQYFRLNRLNFLILSFWKLSKSGLIQEAVERKIKRPLQGEELSALLRFLFENELTAVAADGDYKNFHQQSERQKRTLLKGMVHSYLFFKIPLFRPDRFLELTWPFVAGFFTKIFCVIVTLLGVIGLYLTSRQWDQFQDQFVSFLSYEGLIFYGSSLVFVKIIHELGHAYMAHKFGLKVPIIGAAFLVLMPILYTDTANAWRLRSRQQRLLIDFAGIFAELSLAVFATVLWVFLPDGFFRSVVFSIAAVSWILSLLINLNPFMRFDGYYILSDVLGVENLQGRGFALARWRMREILFGLKLPPPEVISSNLRRWLVLHAWGTWIYRFFLFMGIAILVYSFFIKVVAIALFIIEIIWFIALPIFRELRVWWTMRDAIIMTKRTILSCTVLCLLLFSFFAPLSSSVSVSAVMKADNEVTMFPPYSGSLETLAVNQGQRVRAGDVLVELRSEELELKVALSESRIELLERQVARSGADREGRVNRRVVISRLEEERKLLKSLEDQTNRLDVRAPIDGVVVDLNTQLHEGRFVGADLAMFRIKGNGRLELSGLVAEREMERLKELAGGIFYPDNLQFASVPIQVSGIENIAVKKISNLSLAQNFGGGVPTIQSQGTNNGHEVAGGFYRMRMRPLHKGQTAYGQVIRGVVHVDAKPESMARRVFERISSVLLRETGF